MRTTSAVAPGFGSRHENGNPELQVRRGWPARAGMASSGPLPGPDAKKPAFYDDVFLTNAVGYWIAPYFRWFYHTMYGGSLGAPPPSVLAGIEPAAR